MHREPIGQMTSPDLARPRPTTHWASLLNDLAPRPLPRRGRGRLGDLLNPSVSPHLAQHLARAESTEPETTNR